MDVKELKAASITALQSAFEAYRYLLRRRIDRDEIGVNTFGDTVMKIDYECEEAVIDAFRNLADEFNVGFSVVSEEHGAFVIGSNPAYTLFVDGFDGSSKYKQTGGTSRGGPMMAVYLGVNPRFDDYLVAGIADLHQNQMLVGARGQGVTLFAKGMQHMVHASGVQNLSHQTRIYIDEGVGIYDPSFFWAVGGSGAMTLDDKTRIYIDEGVQNYPTFPDHRKGYFYEPFKKSFETKYMGSSAVYFFDIASGQADLDLEYGRKENLEHWTGYGLIKEAGGVMEFVSGGSVAATRYRDYLQLNGGYPAVIIAATPELAAEARSFSNREQL